MGAEYAGFGSSCLDRGASWKIELVLLLSSTAASWNGLVISVGPSEMLKFGCADNSCNSFLSILCLRASSLEGSSDSSCFIWREDWVGSILWKWSKCLRFVLSRTLPTCSAEANEGKSLPLDIWLTFICKRDYMSIMPEKTRPRKHPLQEVDSRRGHSLTENSPDFLAQLIQVTPPFSRSSIINLEAMHPQWRRWKKYKYV